MGSDVPASEQEYYTEFGQRMKAARDLQGMSITDLAAAIQLPEETIRQYEAGTERMQFLTGMLAAHALKVPIGFFTLKFDTQQRVEGEVREYFLSNYGMEGGEISVLAPEVEWAMRNITNKLVELYKSKTASSGDGDNSIALQTPDKKTPI